MDNFLVLRCLIESIHVPRELDLPEAMVYLLILGITSS